MITAASGPDGRSFESVPDTSKNGWTPPNVCEKMPHCLINKGTLARDIRPGQASVDILKDIVHVECSSSSGGGPLPRLYCRAGGTPNVPEAYLVLWICDHSHPAARVSDSPLSCPVSCVARSAGDQLNSTYLLHRKKMLHQDEPVSEHAWEASNGCLMV